MDDLQHFRDFVAGVVLDIHAGRKSPLPAAANNEKIYGFVRAQAVQRGL